MAQPTECPVRSAAGIEWADVLYFVELSKDVQNFLFNPGDTKKVELFREFITEAPLD